MVVVITMMTVKTKKKKKNVMLMMILLLLQCKQYYLHLLLLLLLCLPLHPAVPLALAEHQSQSYTVCGPSRLWGCAQTQEQRRKRKERGGGQQLWTADRLTKRTTADDIGVCGSGE